MCPVIQNMKYIQHDIKMGKEKGGGRGRKYKCVVCNTYWLDKKQFIWTVMLSLADKLYRLM